jgi:NADH-quinone oxidoreductase subunit A
MLENYFSILMFVLVGQAIGVLSVVMGWLLAPNCPDAEKRSPYKCGFEA